jgi:hypothetical protein
LTPVTGSTLGDSVQLKIGKERQAHKSVIAMTLPYVVLTVVSFKRKVGGWTLEGYLSSTERTGPSNAT